MNITDKAVFDDMGRVAFSDPAAMLAAVELAAAGDRRGNWTDSDSHRRWVGESLAETKARAATGDISGVEKAEAMIDKIDVELDRAGVEFVHDVAGAYPDVAAFLANDPENMIRRRHVELSEKAPVRVFVCTTSSAGVSAENLAKRGIAALALAMALIRQGRAVELFTFSTVHGDKGDASIVVCKMRTSPVDLSSVAWCMTSGGHSRSMPYTIAGVNGFDGRWSQGKRAKGIMDDDLSVREAACRRLLGDWCSPSDVVLSNVFHGDERRQGSPLADPVAWVLKHLAAVAENAE
jgi:hypothetical protein